MCTPMWFPGRIPFSIPSCISISSAIFAGLTIMTDRPTDIYVLRSTVMWPNNNILDAFCAFFTWPYRPHAIYWHAAYIWHAV